MRPSQSQPSSVIDRSDAQTTFGAASQPLSTHPTHTNQKSHRYGRIPQAHGCITAIPSPHRAQNHQSASSSTSKPSARPLVATNKMTVNGTEPFRAVVPREAITITSDGAPRPLLRQRLLAGTHGPSAAYAPVLEEAAARRQLRGPARGGDNDVCKCCLIHPPLQEQPPPGPPAFQEASAWAGARPA